MSIVRTRHRLSVADYGRMIDFGILTENDRVELIHGEIVEKMSIGEFHAGCVNRLTRFFTLKFGRRAVVAVQNPIRLADSEPEPDISILKPRDDDYAAGHPTPADVLLIVEVADASLDYDRDVKGPLYAANGIAEYWILNLVDRTLEIRRQPQGAGGYAEVRTLSGEDAANVALLPDVSVKVSELFPPTA